MSVERAEGLRPCGGPSRNDRTPANFASCIVSPSRRGQGAEPDLANVERRALRHLRAELTTKQESVLSLSMGTMSAVQRGLFGEDYELSEGSSFGEGWRDRADLLARMSAERGGLVPVSALPDVLGITRQQVHHLSNIGDLEAVKVCGVTFITGRSIEAWEAHRRAEGTHPGGKGNRRAPGMWRKVVISAKTGSAIADVLAPD